MLKVLREHERSTESVMDPTGEPFLVTVCSCKQYFDTPESHDSHVAMLLVEEARQVIKGVPDVGWATSVYADYPLIRREDALASLGKREGAS